MSDPHIQQQAANVLLKACATEDSGIVAKVCDFGLSVKLGGGGGGGGGHEAASDSSTLPSPRSTPNGVGQEEPYVCRTSNSSVLSHRAAAANAQSLHQRTLSSPDIPRPKIVRSAEYGTLR